MTPVTYLRFLEPFPESLSTPSQWQSINLEWLVATLSNLTRQIVELIAFTLKLNKLGSRFGCFVRVRIGHVPFIVNLAVAF